jgi:hypothetical protein
MFYLEAFETVLRPKILSPFFLLRISVYSHLRSRSQPSQVTARSGREFCEKLGIENRSEKKPTNILIKEWF